MVALPVQEKIDLFKKGFPLLSGLKPVQMFSFYNIFFYFLLPSPLERGWG
jgi:hypothetical protein